MLGREFIPPKPDPAPILHICTEWGFDPAQVVTVGDSIDDMLAGKRAGTGQPIDSSDTMHDLVNDLIYDSLQ